MNSAQFTLKNEWSTGLTAEIAIQNKNSQVLDGWLFEFVADFEITSFWNAELVQRDGDRYVSAISATTARSPLDGIPALVSQPKKQLQIAISPATSASMALP